MAMKASLTDSNVLIIAESGTGKELFAHAIHRNSKRGYSAFVKVNCAAIPPELLEAELFGYEDGAFTGAKKGGKIGKFEIADGGTIF
ncbi:sigma 54-interacting transcriptional regulator [Caloramator sp. mosi_1]|nr:sigma 54-interacting transcriptional regulator [Caloramator sp. mosi_1]WDC84343.1 sigma 54-interacting transcriptional regulator [Caloramator sp. mosi_1]